MSLVKSLLGNTLVRFFLVAALNTIFGYGIFALAIFMGIKFFIATLISTVLGILFNFKTYGKLVFSHNDNKLFYSFLLVYTFIYGVNTGGIALLKLLGLTSYEAGAVLTIPVGLLGYILNRNFVFKKPRVVVEN